MQWMGQGVGQKREEDSSGLTPLPSEFGRDLGFTFWIFFVWILRFSRQSKPGKEYIEASWLVRDFHGDLRAEMLRFHCDISFPKSISILQVRSILHHSLFFRVQLQLKAHTHTHTRLCLKLYTQCSFLLLKKPIQNLWSLWTWGGSISSLCYSSHLPSKTDEFSVSCVLQVLFFRRILEPRFFGGSRPTPHIVVDVATHGNLWRMVLRQF